MKKCRQFSRIEHMLKQQKKGVFFTIDSILAAGIIVATIIFASSLYAEEQPTFYLNYLSQDIINGLSAVTVGQSSNGYIKELIGDGTITNKGNTILEQIVEFWAEGEIALANKTAMNATDHFVPDAMGFGVWIDNGAVYTRDDAPIKKSLVSSKKIISGIEKGKTTGLTRENPPTLLGPVVFEVRVWQ